MAEPFIGFPRGIFQGGSGNPFIAAELRHDLTRIARVLDDLATKKLSQAAETALRQTISDICFGAQDDVAGDFEVRTSVLDGNTCQICRDLDGTMFRIGSEAHEEYRPPRHCESEKSGTSRCRCVYDPVLPGQTGWQLTGHVTESTSERVAGEIHIARVGETALSTPKLASIAKTSRRKTLTEERESAFFSAFDQLEVVEAQLIIREAMTSGKPILARNLLAAMEFLASTGTVPAISQRGTGELVRLRL